MAYRFGFISTYPPTQCGLATFTSALLQALTASGTDEGRVARLLDVPERSPGGKVVAHIVADGSPRPAGSAQRLNDCDVVIVQHEFGVYGGPDGVDVLRLLAQLTVPTIVVLHTVLTNPSGHQRQVLESVVEAASAVVTMTATARDRLTAGYRVDPGKISIIAHGAPDLPSSSASLSAVFRGGAPTVLTWGLLGPGKGIEWGIEALGLLGDLRPAPRYLIAGQTHPKVLEREGEAYRDSLGRLVRQRGLTGSVNLDPRYRDTAALAELVASADVVLLPYDSAEQVTSGVLIEAVAAGKPVVATRFPHAVELLSDGAGLVVPHRDPTATAAALRMVLTGPGVAAAMSAAAATAAPGLRWSAVADQYRSLATRLIADAAAAATSTPSRTNGGCLSTHCSPRHGRSTATASTTPPEGSWSPVANLVLTRSWSDSTTGISSSCWPLWTATAAATTGWGPTVLGVTRPVSAIGGAAPSGRLASPQCTRRPRASALAPGRASWSRPSDARRPAVRWPSPRWVPARCSAAGPIDPQLALCSAMSSVSSTHRGRAPAGRGPSPGCATRTPPSRRP
jgi:glycosyltransferase involved in cell wall biosynthesis